MLVHTGGVVGAPTGRHPCTRVHVGTGVGTHTVTDRRAQPTLTCTHVHAYALVHPNTHTYKSVAGLNSLLKENL